MDGPEAPRRRIDALLRDTPDPNPAAPTRSCLASRVYEGSVGRDGQK